MNRIDEKPVSQIIKLLLEFGPLVVFFMGNRYGNELAEIFPALANLGGRVFVGTALFMIAMTVSLIASRIITGSFAIMPMATGFFVLVFGGLTLYLQNDTFIKMKPTIANLIFSAMLLGGLVFRKSLLAHVFDSAFKLDSAGWKKLTFRWGLFFIVMAVLNEIVWRNASTDFWVTFKTWGVMPLTVIFMMTQFSLLKKHSTEALFNKE